MGNVKLTEIVVDIACALVNLKLLFNLGWTQLIPPRAPHAWGSHIITRQETPDLKIPAIVNTSTPAFPSHLKRFQVGLSAIVPLLSQMLKTGSDESCFAPNVAVRGERLYQGGYLLQLRVQGQQDDTWLILWKVGASYSAKNHQGIVELKRDVGIFRSHCTCHNG